MTVLLTFITVLVGLLNQTHALPASFVHEIPIYCNNTAPQGAHKMRVGLSLNKLLELAAPDRGAICGPHEGVVIPDNDALLDLAAPLWDAHNA